MSVRQVLIFACFSTVKHFQPCSWKALFSLFPRYLGAAWSYLSLCSSVSHRWLNASWGREGTCLVQHLVDRRLPQILLLSTRCCLSGCITLSEIIFSSWAVCCFLLSFLLLHLKSTFKCFCSLRLPLLPPPSSLCCLFCTSGTQSWLPLILSFSYSLGSYSSRYGRSY